MSSNCFREFCIVGLGAHALTKLVPAIQANGQTVTATVDNRMPATIPGAVHYKDVAEAVEALPPHTTFIVATPPSVHLPLAQTIALHGFDLFVEKPAFVTRGAAQTVTSICHERGSVLVEGFMHRHTRLHSALIDYWSRCYDRAAAIHVRFVIPAMPTSTFRSGSELACASIFDIGCYPVCLLHDLGLRNADLHLSDVRFPGQPEKELVRLEATCQELAIVAEIGVDLTYANSVEITTEDGRAVRFAPYFYGRAGEKTISETVGDHAISRPVSDVNAFEAMLAVPRDMWLQHEAERNSQIIGQAAALETLAQELQSIRTGNSAGIGRDGTMG
jgi:predicted dehydrogenase